MDMDVARAAGTKMAQFFMEMSMHGSKCSMLLKQGCRAVLMSRLEISRRETGLGARVCMQRWPAARALQSG